MTETVAADQLEPTAETPPHPLPELLANSSRWTDDMVAGAGIPVQDSPIASVGGGIGSYILTDYLRVAGGVPTSGLRVVSNLGHPWQTYERLATASQISSHDRIRSDSASRPDNIWGFPSYALQEAVQERSLAPLAQVFLEPVFDDFYTPRLGVVMRSIRKEAQRIRYWDMLVRGEAQLVRRRAGGGYFVLFLDPRAEDPRPMALRVRDVHLAVGYPGLKFLPEIQEFRRLKNDFHRVANAYQNHEHIYQALRRRPGTVLVRGGGIVASRVLERLILDRERHGHPTRIIHLLRTYVNGPHGPHRWARRPGRDGFAYQGFNYPKSVWGGQLRARTAALDGAERAEVYDEIGGTTTAYRREWQRQLRKARAEGWYHAVCGTLAELQDDGETLTARMKVAQGEFEIEPDFVIDCTGLNADVSGHQVLRDLLQHGGARRNPLGGMDVKRSFELIGAQSGVGRVYVTGAAALGGPFPGVDTFLGLQIAAQEVVDDIAGRGFCRKLGPVTSTFEWLRWAAGRRI
ncbi:hypothetical protein [Amycolatopsis sp. NPDC021455]|uniref:hypothetical protein n=1 Tax=Amycolatopsis sp. NPDC021455 TaxID=3154901 RepID=UPI0033C15AA4